MQLELLTHIHTHCTQSVSTHSDPVAAGVFDGLSDHGHHASKHTTGQAHQPRLQMVSACLAALQDLLSLLLVTGVKCSLAEHMRQSPGQL